MLECRCSQHQDFPRPARYQQQKGPGEGALDDSQRAAASPRQGSHQEWVPHPTWAGIVPQHNDQYREQATEHCCLPRAENSRRRVLVSARNTAYRAETFLEPQPPEPMPHWSEYAPQPAPELWA